MEISTQVPVSFTPPAIREINRLMNEEGFDKNKTLRVGVKGGGCSGMTYILEFDMQKPNDDVYNIDGITFIMDRSHAIYLTGMEVNWEDGLNARGFTFSNPNASATCGCGTSFAV